MRDSRQRTGSIITLLFSHLLRHIVIVSVGGLAMMIVFGTDRLLILSAGGVNILLSCRIKVRLILLSILLILVRIVLVVALTGRILWLLIVLVIAITGIVRVVASNGSI